MKSDHPDQTPDLTAGVPSCVPKGGTTYRAAFQLLRASFLNFSRSAEDLHVSEKVSITNDRDQQSQTGKKQVGETEPIQGVKKTIDILVEIRADISSIKHNTIILFFKRNILKKRAIS